MRLVIAECQVDYLGRLTAHLPMASRLILVKADGSVAVHADDRAYKPLNWMSPPCTLREETTDGAVVWTVSNTKTGDRLVITFGAVAHDSRHDLGIDPGLVKDGVEAHLQELLADQIETLGPGYRCIRREYPTAIGPVDILARDPAGVAVAIEIKRRGEIDGTIEPPAPGSKYTAVEVKRRATIASVEQLTRYVELLNRDPLLAPVAGVLAAQEITPQARTLAEDRGLRCLILDYEAMRGLDDPTSRLF